MGMDMDKVFKAPDNHIVKLIQSQEQRDLHQIHSYVIP